MQKLKYRVWKWLTRRLVKDAAIGNQFIGFITALMTNSVK